MAVATPVGAPSACGSGAPARVKYLFGKLDADDDGRITWSQLRGCFEAEFEPLPPRAAAQLASLFERNAIGDLHFAERYVNKTMFNALYAEVLFMAHDADADGVLTCDEAQAALSRLVRPPPGGGPKPLVPFACPADPSGAMCVPAAWFGQLYRGMT